MIPTPATLPTSSRIPENEQGPKGFGPRDEPLEGSPGGWTALEHSIPPEPWRRRSRMSTPIRGSGRLPLLIFLMAALLAAPTALGGQETKKKTSECEQEVREAVERLRGALLRQRRELEHARQETLARAEEVRARARDLRERASRTALAQAAEIRSARSQEKRELRRELEARAREVRRMAAEASRERRDELRAVRGDVGEAREKAGRLRERLADLREGHQQVVVRLRSRARLGVEIDAEQGREADERGARVQGVVDGSPAEEAGLREGDVITHLDGHSLLEPLPDDEDEEVLDPDESLPVQRLVALARELEPGKEVEIRYLRDGNPETVMVEAAEVEPPFAGVLGDEGRSLGRIRIVGPEGDLEGLYLPELRELRLESLDELEELEDLGVGEWHHLWREGPEASKPERGLLRPWAPGPRGFSTWSPGGAGGVAGLRFVDLNPELGEYFSASRGALILDVDEDVELDVRPGDVIQDVDGRAVEDSGDLRRILRSYERDEPISFNLVRKGETVTVEGRWREGD